MLFIKRKRGNNFLYFCDICSDIQNIILVTLSYSHMYQRDGHHYYPTWINGHFYEYTSWVDGRARSNILAASIKAAVDLYIQGTIIHCCRRHIAGVVHK